MIGSMTWAPRVSSAMTSVSLSAALVSNAAPATRRPPSARDSRVLVSIVSPLCGPFFIAASRCQALGRNRTRRAAVGLLERALCGASQVSAAVTVLPLNHPLLIAEEIATLDHISEGRLDSGRRGEA